MTYTEHQLAEATIYAQDACKQKADSAGHLYGSESWQQEYERCLDLIPREPSAERIVEWADSILYELSIT